MNISHLKFHRVFSKTMHKTLQIPLGEMTFTKDFVSDTRGDLYPIIAKESLCQEQIADNLYTVQSGAVERMFVRFVPYGTYEISFSMESGNCGFVFHLPDCAAKLCFNGAALVFSDGINQLSMELTEQFSAISMVVSCRPGAFDVYLKKNGKATYVHTFQSAAFAESNQQRLFEQGFVSVFAEGTVTVSGACAYMDCGISQADIRAVCYENTEPIFENGKIFFTATVRMQEGGFQGIFSWTPSTSSIAFTGALFFDCGDGLWRNYLASSLLYNRKTKQWYLWTSSFEHKHILCYAAFDGEPRFGVNVIDVKTMEPAKDQDFTAFVGFKGDEDPDFYYNEQEDLWYMAICRIAPATRQYQYMFFKSHDPFREYTYIGQGYAGSETGGSFVNFGGEMAFVCGNSFSKRANYRIYTKDGMQEASFDFDDGGFRGWGTVIPVTMGSRKRYFWLTFDRHNGSTYSWSYGNIYGFEAIL